MDEMREIVTVEQVERLFVILAIALPILGIVGGVVLGARRGNIRRGATLGLLLGILGPINLGLWMLYNRITDRLGLDTVKNLLVNMGIFVVLGIGAGIAAGIILRRMPGAEPAPDPAQSESVSEA